jgi:hypothetical protein
MRMAYDYRGLDWSIAAALGDDGALLGELHQALVQDAREAANLLERSRCDANWTSAARKLENLAMSFGSKRLEQAAKQALSLAPNDPTSIRAITRAIDSLEWDAFQIR